MELYEQEGKRYEADTWNYDGYNSVIPTIFNQRTYSVIEDAPKHLQ